MSKTIIDPKLIEFATVRQIEYIQAIEEHGSMRKAAKALGVAKNAVQESMNRLRTAAALKGYSPQHDMHHPVAPGQQLRGVSTYYDKDGKAAGQWVKTSTAQEAFLEMIRDVARGFVEDIGPVDVAPAPLDFQSDVIPWIQIGDAHLGMLAHANEVGENFDLKIAEQELCAAIGILIDELPSCERLVINDLGDATHYENFEGETQVSKNRLDCDTRFPKMIKVYSRVMRFIVDKALTKARHVDVIVNQGNHSRTNDI